MVLKNLNTFIPKVRALRAYGSAGINLCYLAMGSVDAYFEFGFHIWDYAAPLLIGEDIMPSKNMIFFYLNFQVSEAGGFSVDTDGGEVDYLARRMLAASSKDLIQQIQPLITSIQMERD